MKGLRVKKQIIPVICVALFVILATLVDNGVIAQIDSAAYNIVTKYMSPLLTLLAKAASMIGEAPVIILSAALLLAWPALRWSFGYPVAVTAGSSCFLNLALKQFFCRQRPDILRLITESGFSFPSGHAMNNMAFYTIIVLLIWDNIGSMTAKIAITAAACLLVLAIGLSRIYLGVHYFSDVMGGYLMGFAVAITVYQVCGKKKNPSI